MQNNKNEQENIEKSNEPNANKNKNKNNKKLLWIIIILIVALSGALTYFIYTKNNDEKNKIEYTELIRDMDQGKIGKVEMTIGGSSAVVTYRDENGYETKIEHWKWELIKK